MESGVEKIEKQWKKVELLVGKGEWSAGLARAVTAVEASVELAIQSEMALTPSLKRPQRGGGLGPKFHHTLIPMAESNGRNRKAMEDLYDTIKHAVKLRNETIHFGDFASEDDEGAESGLDSLSSFIVSLMKMYAIHVDLGQYR